MIYLVSLGYNYEGQDVQKAFKSLNSAEIFVEEYIKEDSKILNWHSPWVKKNSKIWESGSKYLLIEEIELED